MLKSIFSIILILTISLSFSLYAQDTIPKLVLDTMELKPSYGIVGGYNVDFHSTDFRNLPGVPNCCPQFTEGQGKGYYGGILIDYPLNYDFTISTRLIYNYFDGKLTYYEQTPIILDGKQSTGEFEHLVDAKFSMIAIEPLFAYNIIPNLSLISGFSAGFLTKADYYQIEKITKPSDRGTFLDGRSYRNQNEGSILDSANLFQFGFKFGVSYRLPFNKSNSLFATPEIFYSYYPSDLMRERVWNIHQLSVGISFKYRIPPPPPPPPTPPVNPPDPELPIITKIPFLACDVEAVEIDSNNRENRNIGIRVEDFISYNMRPLLTYVFFDENSSAIPSRYHLIDSNFTHSFKIDDLANLNALDTYYNMLNIIGKRLIDIPDANITIVGNNANVLQEKNNKSLSLDRANSVAHYLNSVWKVPFDRIKIESRNLPKESSRLDDTLGMQENRRVEIYSNNPAITEPVFTVDTMRVLSTSGIKFIPKVLTEAGIKHFEFTSNRNNIKIMNKRAETNLPTSFIWIIDNKNIPKDNVDLTYSLIVTDSVGQSISSPLKKIPLTKKTVDSKRRSGQADKEFEYYSLILFDYGKSNLANQHKNVVDFIKNRISPDSKISVFGYTDSMGDDNINQSISDKRAKSVLKRLDINIENVEGKGESNLLYDNSLPEGRFYCRTVTINIETPVKPY